jgi:hypothetical protein
MTGQTHESYNSFMAGVFGKPFAFHYLSGELQHDYYRDLRT